MLGVAALLACLAAACGPEKAQEAGPEPQVAEEPAPVDPPVPTEEPESAPAPEGNAEAHPAALPEVRYYVISDA